MYIYNTVPGSRARSRCIAPSGYPQYYRRVSRLIKKSVRLLDISIGPRPSSVAKTGASHQAGSRYSTGVPWGGAVASSPGQLCCEAGDRHVVTPLYIGPPLPTPLLANAFSCFLWKVCVY